MSKAATGVERIECDVDICKSTDDVREVRIRVPGKATAYQSKTRTLCRECRKRWRGEFAYVK
jgi:hypothetical protein